jgi:hypothetical protein
MRADSSQATGAARGGRRKAFAHGKPMEQVIFNQEDFAAGQQGFVASSPLQASQWGSMQKSHSTVVLDIGKFLVKYTLPAGVVNARLAQPTPTGPPLPSVRLDSPRRAALLSHRSGHRLLPSLEGLRDMFYRCRSVKNLQCGCTVADHFVLLHSAQPKTIPWKKAD